jgi:hypothetical protein
MNGMKNAKLRKLVKIMMRSVFRLMTGTGNVCVPANDAFFMKEKHLPAYWCSGYMKLFKELETKNHVNVW